MTKMIRCIEGHVFDIDAQDKCPQCGWVPAAKKEKPMPAASASPLAPIGALFGALIAAVDGLLAKIGLSNKPGLAAGIVYACVILLLVGGASALTGVFRGNGSSTPVNAPVNTPTNVNVRPAEKEIPKTPAPKQQAQPQQQAPAEPAQQQQQQQQPALQQQQVAPRQHQNPQIHVPGEVRRILRQFF